MTLVGLGVIGMMAYAFIAPRLLSKPKVVQETVTETAGPTAAQSAIPAIPGELYVGVPNNVGNAKIYGDPDLDMNFAGVAFAENVPGLSYGFPMAGVV